MDPVHQAALDGVRRAERTAARREENTLGQYTKFTVDDARRYHAATYSIGMGAARLFSRSVDLTGRRLMLDLGGGSGAYSIVATKTFPGLKAIVLDLPPVAVVAQEYIAANDAADRVSAMAGDFTTSAFPQGVDVVVMASNLPQYEPALIRLVVGKAFAALVPGGEMHLIGETLHDDRHGPLSAALWGLNEAVQGSTGVAHTEGEVRSYLQDAGFTGVSGASVRARRPVAGDAGGSRDEAGVASARSLRLSSGLWSLLPSSRGLGRGPLKAKTRVRIP